MLPQATPPAHERTPVLRKVVAGVVLLAAAALAVHLVIGLVMTVFWLVVGAAVVLAVLWALKTIVWQLAVAGGGLLVIMFFFGLAGGVVGRIKGSSFFIWFLVAGLVPFLGLLAAVCYRYEDRELRRECPGCGKVVKLYDALCTRCGTELEFPEVAIAPESRQVRRRARRSVPGPSI